MSCDYTGELRFCDAFLTMLFLWELGGHNCMKFKQKVFA